MNITYEVYDSIRKEYYIRDEETVLDDLIDMLDEASDRYLHWPYNNFGLKHMSVTTATTTLTSVQPQVCVKSWRGCVAHTSKQRETRRHTTTCSSASKNRSGTLPWERARGATPPCKSAT